MSAPKSVMKIKNGNVEFTSNVDAANYYIFELSRAALRDVARYVRNTFKARYYEKFKKHTGNGPRSISGKVLSKRNTMYPRVEIGILHSGPSTTVRGFYAYWHEKGSFKQAAEWILKTTVESNIAEIIRIESQYLSGLNDSYEALCPGEEDIMIEED